MTKHLIFGPSLGTNSARRIWAGQERNNWKSGWMSLGQYLLLHYYHLTTYPVTIIYCIIIMINYHPSRRLRLLVLSAPISFNWWYAYWSRCVTTLLPSVDGVPHLTKRFTHQVEGSYESAQAGFGPFRPCCFLDQPISPVSLGAHSGWGWAKVGPLWLLMYHPHQDLGRLWILLDPWAWAALDASAPWTQGA